MKIFTVILFLLITIFFWDPAKALEGNIVCESRYVTLVNPVRGRNLWIDKSLKPIQDQYYLVNENDFSATWLLQYDVLIDNELLNEIKKFDAKQEKGIFLEVSQNLADQARVIYPYDAAWFSPRAVFLSGYSPSDRRKLIDRLFWKFKSEFGFYPQSVGAWWIDSYSLNYMQDKYNISSALIVADQKTTDNYGVWGQWWGVPYYPSKYNILTPPSDLKNKQNVVVLQWAQRDLTRAAGEGPAYSNYSLQANDYLRQGEDTAYFTKLVKTYLDCQNPLGQVTVGLETGIESVGYIGEYEKQLGVLKNIAGLQPVSMSRFAQHFKRVYPEYPQDIRLVSSGSAWLLTTVNRSNAQIGDRITYQADRPFKDYFIADKSDFLNRRLDQAYVSKDFSSWVPWYLIIVAALGMLSVFRDWTKVWLISSLFSVSAFGLILRSNYQHGWEVYYGAVVPYLQFAQAGLILLSFLAILGFSKIKVGVLGKTTLSLWLLPLSFGFDYLLQNLRFTLISHTYYFGFMLDNLRFAGISFSSPWSLSLVNKDFPAYQAAALLRFDYTKIWDNLLLSLLAYPVIHIIAAAILSILTAKLPFRLRRIAAGLMAVLFLLYLLGIYQADPRVVK